MNVQNKQSEGAHIKLGEQAAINQGQLVQAVSYLHFAGQTLHNWATQKKLRKSNYGTARSLGTVLSNSFGEG